MSDIPAAQAFQVGDEAYDAFMGRYSKPLSVEFADLAKVRGVGNALDVGCGPGALTAELVNRLGAGHVSACDPSKSMTEACERRNPGVEVRVARAESLPYEDDAFDHALAQLVLHFVSDPALAAREMTRVVRPGGTVSACSWEFHDGMEMLRAFWDAAVAVDSKAPDEAQTLPFGRLGEIADLFVGAGLTAVEEASLRVSSTYSDFDELWAGFMGGVGPAGSFCVSLPEVDQKRLRKELFTRLGSPKGPFTLGAVAIAAVGVVSA